MLPTQQQMEHALVSIVVGALVAFITALLQGLLHWVQGSDFITGPVAGATAYIIQTVRQTRLV